MSADGLLYVKNVAGTPCSDGWYSFRTRVPIRQYNVFRYDGRDAGNLWVNGARITFSLADPVPPPPWYTPGADEKPTRVLVNMGPAGTFAQRTELSQPQKTLLAKLKITEPPRIFDATPATA